MIVRIWHGWTSLENADSYYNILTNQVIPGIKKMKLEGFNKIDILRKTHSQETEFITMMYFDSIEHIKNFTGEDYEVAHVPEEAQLILSRWDLRSLHYELMDHFSY